MAACGSSNAPAPSAQSTGPSEQQIAAVSLQVSIPSQNFTGNSVRICGARPAADAKYRCFSDLNNALLGTTNPTDIVAPANSVDANGEPNSNCPCFTFADVQPGDPANGNVTGFFASPNPGPTDIATPLPADALGVSFVPNLCPSGDVGVDPTASAQWTFSYAIYSDGSCGGSGGQILNTGDNAANFVCFSPLGLADPGMAVANETTEPLQPGENANHLFCTSVGAEKSFDFTACTQTCVTAPDENNNVTLVDSTPTPGANGVPVCPAEGAEDAFNCGCTLQNDICVCNPSGLQGAIGAEPTNPDTQANIPGCRFVTVNSNEEQCTIVCPAEPIEDNLGAVFAEALHNVVGMGNLSFSNCDVTEFTASDTVAVAQCDCGTPAMARAATATTAFNGAFNSIGLNSPGCTVPQSTGPAARCDITCPFTAGP